ncbi:MULTISPECIES: hypothetical protein [unclassified Streptomyces]|uniref:hypothetical protein n=1 Tax=unclassified Streptomyces TaxID=2593676 RepID=UPI00365A3842
MRTRMFRGVAAAVTVSALCFTAAACGGEDEKKPAASGEKSKDKGGEEKPAEASTTPLTAEQLKAATLEAKDLPAGWTGKTAEADTTKPPTADKPECQPIANMMAGTLPGGTGGPNMEFSTKGENDNLSEQVFTFEGTGAAEFTKAIGTALETCKAAVFTQDGEKTKVTFAKLSAPKAGEESHAFTMGMSMEGLGADVKISMLVARQGTGVARAAYVAIDNPKSEAAFGDLVTRMGAKLVKGAQG